MRPSSHLRARASAMGNLDFSDYIGDPRDQFKTYYRGLRKIKDLYWQKYTSPNSFWDYMRILKFYDKAIFEQIKSLIHLILYQHYEDSIKN
jgi:hypothetical protein